MNILIMNGGKGWGGIESHGVILTLALKIRGHQVILACPETGQVKDNAIKLGLPTKDINVANSADIFAVLMIKNLIQKERCQAVIANLGKEYWPVAIAGKLAGVKVIFVRHQMDYLKKTTVWLISHFVDKVIAVSNAVRERLIESGVPVNKIEVIYNGIELGKFNPHLINRKITQEKLGIKSNEIVIGNAGKLDRGKGVVDLVHAFKIMSATYPSAKLLFVGEGPLRQELELEVKRLNIEDKVIFAGLRREMVEMYGIMDIFVLPSHWEAFGMSLVEAMSIGIPTIATKVGGIPEILIHEKNGLLIQPGESEKLADAIKRYLSDKEFAQQMAMEGQRTVETSFTDSVMAKKFEDMLTRLDIC